MRVERRPTGMERDDATLLTAHMAGDGMAFAELLNRYAAPVLGYLVRMTGSREQAEDLFQETFLRVHSKADTFRPGAPFKPWLYTIATRLTIDWTRRRGREAAVIEPNCPCDDVSVERHHEALASTPDPSEAAADTEQREEVRRAVDSLPPRQRATLLLAYYEGLTYSEVAGIMNCSVGTVKTQMSRALERLSGVLAGLRSGPPPEPAKGGGHA